MSGIDWDAVKAKYEARLDYEEAQGMNPVERDAQRRHERELAQRQAERVRNRRVLKGRPAPKFDRDTMVELYTAGVSMKGIARQLGCDDWTVSKALRARGIERGPQSLGGRPRGHLKSNVLTDDKSS